MNKVNDIGKLIAETQIEILDLWIKQIVLGLKPLFEEIAVKEMQRHTSELLNVFVKAVEITTDVQSKEFVPVLDRITKFSCSMTQANISPVDTSLLIFSLKDAIVPILQKQIDDSELSLAIIIVNNIINRLSLHSFNVYLTSRESISNEQVNALLETSVPVVKLLQGILFVPFIGILDSSRIQHIKEKTLSQIEISQAKAVIFDISGIETIDLFVARQLTNTANAVRLMGCECIITGIRAEISQTIIRHGIDLSNVVTKMTLEEGIRYALAKTGKFIRSEIER